MVSLTKTLSLLLLSSLAIFISAHDIHSCDHDNIKQNPGMLHIQEDMSSIQNGRNLQQSDSSSASTYPNIRIQTYTDFLAQTASSTFTNYIEKQILPPIVDYFQAALRVKYPVVGNLQLSNSINQICERSTPEILYQGVAADFFIYFDTLSNSGSQIANTMFCFLASGTGRPLIARTVVNPSMVPIPNGDVLIHEKNMLVILHEMVHGLGFSSSSFPYFIDSNANRLSEHVTTSNIGGQTYGVLNVPVLTNKLRDYFGCNSVPGAILENSGGSATASSHFERQFFLYELMTSGSILGLRTSELTLTVLEASGWYAPDYSYGEPFTFGQGQGCSFLNYQCTGSSMWDNEFCTGTNAQRGCSPTGRGGGYCNSDPLLGNCRYMYAFENQDCEYDDGYNDARLPNVEVYGRGAGSKCFTGDLNTRASSNGQTSFCFKYTCNNNGLATTLDVQLGSTSVTCTQAGQMTVDGYYGSIDCPDPMTFCSTIGVQYCPRNCMGRGTCVNNTCKCDAGYSGTDCALGPLGA